LTFSLDDSSTPGADGGGNAEQTLVDTQDAPMDDSQPNPGTANATLDVTVVSMASDWPDNVIFDSTRPNASLPEHLKLSDGVPLPPIDSIRPIITTRRNLPPCLSPKPILPSPLGAKRNVPFGSPLKSAKSEGGVFLTWIPRMEPASRYRQQSGRRRKRQLAPIGDVPSTCQST
jgi:hypothetical protein